MDLDSARTELGSRAPLSSVRVHPVSQARLAALREAARESPRLQVRIEAEREHQSRQFSRSIGRVRLFAWGLALLLAVGAIVGSVNTMSALVEIRERPVATLRALGFDPWATVMALFAEAVLLGLVGAGWGAGTAFLVADGYGLSVLNGATSTPFALSATVTVASMGQGLALACLLTALAAIVSVKLSSLTRA